MKKCSLIVLALGLLSCAENDVKQQPGNGQEPGNVECKAQCSGNVAQNCVNYGNGVEKTLTSCPGDTPFCSLTDGQAVCVKACTETCSADGKIALHCASLTSPQTEEICGDTHRCKFLDGKATCQPKDATQIEECKTSCIEKDGKNIAVNCEENKTVESECGAAQYCGIADNKALCKTSCIQGCEQTIVGDRTTHTAVTCPNGIKGDANKTECKGETPVCQAAQDGNTAACVAEKSECVEKCEGNNAVTCPNGKNGEALITECKGETSMCATTPEVRCVAPEKPECVEKCEGNNAVTCPNGKNGESKIIECNLKKQVCAVEFNLALCKNKTGDPEIDAVNAIGKACHCEGDGCKNSGQSIPHGGIISGCAGIDNYAGQNNASMACFRDDKYNQLSFPDGYCSMIATKCEGSGSQWQFYCKLATTGDYDKFNRCPDDSVMATVEVFQDGWLTDNRFFTKVCYQSCETQDDCRNGYECIEKQASVGDTAETRSVKFCNLAKNITETGKTGIVSVSYKVNP